MVNVPATMRVPVALHPLSDLRRNRIPRAIGQLRRHVDGGSAGRHVMGGHGAPPGG
jgi:hypothetical protein